MNIGFKIGLICSIICLASIVYVRYWNTTFYKPKRSRTIKGYTILLSGTGGILGIIYGIAIA